MEKDNSSENDPPLAAFIDNDNIAKSIESNYRNTSGYDIEKVVEYLEDEGDLRIGKVYFNPGDFQKKGSLLHEFNKNLIEPVFTDSYRANDEETKSLADPRMVWDIAKVCHEHPEIEKFAIISGDKDFWPVMRKLNEKGKKGILMYVEGSESDILRETAEKIGWKVYNVPPYRKAKGGR